MGVIYRYTLLDLRKIPTTPDKLPGRQTAFSSDNVATATLSSDKNTFASQESSPGGGEVLRKSSLLKRRQILSQRFMDIILVYLFCGGYTYYLEELKIEDLAAQKKIGAFFGKYRERNFSKGQIIVFSGEHNQDVYYLTSGKVKKFTNNYKGDEIILTIFRPGDFIPISQAINQKTVNRFYYAANGPVTTRVAPTEEVVAMLWKNPDVIMQLLLNVNRAMDEFLGRAVSLMASNALSRVAYEIYIEAKSFGTQDKDGCFIELNERNIAARSGLTRETVNREIRKLKELGAVNVQRRGIIVHDMPALEKKIYKELL